MRRNGSSVCVEAWRRQEGAHLLQILPRSWLGHHRAGRRYCVSFARTHSGLLPRCANDAKLRESIGASVPAYASCFFGGAQGKRFTEPFVVLRENSKKRMTLTCKLAKSVCIKINVQFEALCRKCDYPRNCVEQVNGLESPEDTNQCHVALYQCFRRRTLRWVCAQLLHVFNTLLRSGLSLI